MLTHQIQNTVSGETYNVYLYRGRSVYPHFHKSFELAYLACGTATVTVNGSCFSVGTGDFVMVLPFEPHSFSVSGDGVLTVTVFSGGLVPTFAQTVRGMRGENAVFRCSDPARRFFEAGIAATEAEPITAVPHGAALLETQARLLAVCSEYAREVSLYPCERSNELLARILDYIDRHFREDISIGSAAKALGYSESHLSAVIRNTLHISFKALVHQTRFEYASRLLTSGSCSVTEAALESGFQSVRTFNRVFRALSGGLSPRRSFAPSQAVPEPASPPQAE